MAARIALALLAAAALTYLGLWLVASERERAAAGAQPERAVRLLLEARRAQPDAGPDVARAQALAAGGRADAAVALLHRTVAAEPANALAWGSLANLVETDPETAARARRRVAQLTGAD